MLYDILYIPCILYDYVEALQLVACSLTYTNSGLIGLIGLNRPNRPWPKPQPTYMRKFELDGKSRHFQSVTTDY